MWNLITCQIHLSSQIYLFYSYNIRKPRTAWRSKLDPNNTTKFNQFPFPVHHILYRRLAKMHRSILYILKYCAWNWTLNSRYLWHRQRYLTNNSEKYIKTNFPADSNGKLCGIDVPNYPFVYFA